jgi:hypothetical protein
MPFRGSKEAAQLGDYPERGILDGGRGPVRERVLGAWDEFIRVAKGADLQAPSRLTGWRNHEICVHLGSWPDADYQPIVGVLTAAQEARAGKERPAPLVADELNAMITARQQDATRDQVIAALERNRQQAAAYLESDDPNPLDDVSVVSTVGALPTLTILHAQVYELAVHALDLADAGAPTPGPVLLGAGLAAMTDATGALAVRVGIKSTASIRSEVGVWAFSASPAGWRVGHWGAPGAPKDPPPEFRGKLPVRVEATATALLEASAARTNPFMAIMTRKLKVSGLPGLLGLAPIVETVPGIPGGPALRVAAKALAGAGGALTTATGALGRLTRR